MYKILVIGPSWVGDAMLVQPMLQRLLQQHSDAHIDIFCPPWTVDLFRAMPEVNEVISNPFPHGALQLKARYQLGKQLANQHYQQAIVLPNSLKSALIPFFANIPLRTGFVGELRYGLLNDARKLDKTALPLMVERFAQLAESAGQTLTRPISQPKLHINLEQQQQTLFKFNLSLSQPVAILCPGAEYGPAKQWPTHYYAEIAQRLQQQGHQLWIIGSAKDRAVAEQIVALNNPHAINLCGKTSMGEAIQLLACAQIVLSNDSGLMHVSAALDRPLIALYGSSSPQFTPPLSAQAHVMKLDNMACSPCFKRQCPLQHFNCMNQLTPDLIWRKIQSILTSAS